MKLKKIDEFLLSSNFIKTDRFDYFRNKGEFIHCINFQRKSTGDFVFINLGVNPVFGFENNVVPDKEIDCYIRYRANKDDELSVVLLESDEGINTIISKIKEQAFTFFDCFNSLGCVFGSIGIVDIEKNNIPDVLSSVPSARLVEMCMDYHYFTRDWALAHKFATYGLSIANRSVYHKIKFKNMIKQLG